MPLVGSSSGTKPECRNRIAGGWLDSEMAFQTLDNRIGTIRDSFSMGALTISREKSLFGDETIVISRGTRQVWFFKKTYHWFKKEEYTTDYQPFPSRSVLYLGTNQISHQSLWWNSIIYAYAKVFGLKVQGNCEIPHSDPMTY